MTTESVVQALESVSGLTSASGVSTQANSSAPSAGDIQAFQESISKTTLVSPVSTADLDSTTKTLQALVKPLEFIDSEATSISDYANARIDDGTELTPREIIQLTAKSQEFMFHCQLTSNVANRTSDGMQQLFRQQS